MIDRVDPELIEPLEGFMAVFGGSLNLHDIPGVRATFTQMNEMVKPTLPEIPEVTSEDRMVPGPEGAPEVMVRIYRPVDASDALPALLWIHGGGYVLGNVDGDDFLVRQMTRDVGCVVVSVEYRLAPEHPFPAPLEDCYTALKWLADHAGALGVNPARIGIAGASAGGGLAAGLALLARDRGEVAVAFQMPIYPMINDRNVEQASDTVTDTLLWNRENNLIGWRSYLGQEPGSEEVSPYAAPFRAADLAGLPPTYIPVGGLDLFLDEDVAYAHRLMAAGVPTELHVYPGGYHAFDVFAPVSALGQRFNNDRNQILRRALHG
jgi:acetyl esterase/lipase